MISSIHPAVAGCSIVVLLVCSACASATDSAGGQRGDDRIGSTAIPDGGDVAHTTDDAGNASRADVRVESAMRSGSNEIVQLRSSRGIFNVWASYCGKGPRLLKPSGSTWIRLQDDRPAVGTHQSYYLDGKLVTDGSLGCDGGDSCYEWTGPMTVSALEYVRVGTRNAPANSPDATNSGASMDLPDIVSRETAGPYQLELSYMSGACSFEDILVARLPLP